MSYFVEAPIVSPGCDPEPSAFDSLQVDLPPCDWFRRLWFCWEEIPLEVRKELCELGELYVTKDSIENAVGLAPDGVHALD